MLNSFDRYRDSKMRNYMKTAGRLFLWLAGILAGIAVMAALLCVLLHATADMKEPSFSPSESLATVSDSMRVWNGNILRINRYGQWEMMVAGSPSARGEAVGKLAPDLLYNQEKVFADKLFEMVPNRAYRRLLSYFITIFNRRLGENVPLECREEIKAMSSACTHEFDEFGNPYERQMQYHSAHDIGHVMQDYMLVGCTSFACWGRESEDSSLVIGRNFDFHIGEEFARNKLILFEKPDSGHAFVSVTWPGMLGVLSGMNTEGLTVTINAARLETPKMSATPISILSRQILQYASTIDEAWAMAEKYRTFVSESILVGSAKDGRAAIIEKTPSEMALHDPAARDLSVNRIICTNHYQSDAFKDRAVNKENIRMSDSMQRFRRVEELLDSAGQLNPVKAAAILRDTRGLDGEPVGYCNELSINQMLAMHSVIFRPASRQIWVSTAPWQCGAFVCYEMDSVLNGDFTSDISEPELLIPEEPFVRTEDFRNVLRFKSMLPRIQAAGRDRRIVPEDSLKRFIGLNPLYYNAYNVVGDYHHATGNAHEACEYWKMSLTFGMKPQERQHIEEKLAKEAGTALRQ